MGRDIKGKNLVIVALLIAVVSFSVAFAATLSSKLTMTGTANIETAKFDVHFESATKTSSSTLNAKNGLNVTNNAITYEVDLEEGKYLEFDAVIKNDGTFDAKVSSLALNGVSDEMSKLVTYSISGLVKDATIKAGESATITVKVAMGTITNDNISLISDNGASLTLTLTADFVQAD
jgi:hypothetical protein